MTTLKHHFLILPAVLGLIAISSNVSAQDQWLTQVHTQLVEASVVFAGEGYVSTHELVTGQLHDGSSELIELQLDAGVQYVILGVCDADCSDLDLVLRDRSGSVVDSDYQVDDVPVVAVQPRQTGIYTVEVSMASCSQEPCRYGVGVYGH
jgi:hypothetical protein